MVKKTIICFLAIDIWLSSISAVFAERGFDVSEEILEQSNANEVVESNDQNIKEKIILPEVSDPIENESLELQISETSEFIEKPIIPEESKSESESQITPPIDAVLKNNEDKEPIKGNGFKLQADSATGALIMEYPIQLPPGRSGLEPDLSLIYNSQNNDNDNIFGYGWSINIPYIERLNKKGVDKLYSNNFFSSSFSGELVNISITNGQFGSYAGKIDDGDFLNYEYLSDNSWKVTDKGGMVFKFGLNSLSRQDDPQNPGKVYKWMLQEIRDPNDNFIRYEYLKEDGQIYPLKIQYTGYAKTDGIFCNRVFQTSKAR